LELDIQLEVGAPINPIHSKMNYMFGIDLGTTFIRSVLSNLDVEFKIESSVPKKKKIEIDTVVFADSRKNIFLGSTN
jgi:hypothetical protein